MRKKNSPVSSPSPGESNPKKKNAPKEKDPQANARAARETVESIVVAVILAFLFRAFLAEAFVIPTGSMAPVLQGRHKDVQCPKCDYWYRAGASIENDDVGDRVRIGGQRRMVMATTCPICRYRQTLDLFHNRLHATYTGDRILVSKFTYDLSPPKRWDVIVFKFPENAKVNYIKRLVGLPGETIRLENGDVFVKVSDGTDFEIARKPDHKLMAMLQLVDDSRHMAPELVEAGWPLRWSSWSRSGGDVAGFWTSADGGRTYETTGSDGREVMLRYRHIIPSPEDWERIESQTAPDFSQRRGQLITDFYAYNAFTSMREIDLNPNTYDPSLTPDELAPYAGAQFGSGNSNPWETFGLHWVGDLVLQANVEIQDREGELVLDLVEGGVHFICRIDVSTGTATLSIDGTDAFFGTQPDLLSGPRAATAMKGPGKYDVRFANVDDEVRLWIDGRRVEFDRPTTYTPPLKLRPYWSESDPGDLAPVGIGTRGLAMRVDRLRVYRDVYYIAMRGDSSTSGHDSFEFSAARDPQQIFETLQKPESWATSRIWADVRNRSTFEVSLAPDQFMPLGDNSPQSSDARFWGRPFVERELLTGKALMIYWPHAWNAPVPFWPNFGRMGFIR